MEHKGRERVQNMIGQRTTLTSKQNLIRGHRILVNNDAGMTG